MYLHPSIFYTPHTLFNNQIKLTIEWDPIKAGLSIYEVCHRQNVNLGRRIIDAIFLILEG